MHSNGLQKAAESSMQKKAGGTCKWDFDQSDQAGQAHGSECRRIIVLKSPHWGSKALNDLEEKSSLAKHH